jgi:polyvinyl alcohol dehydrogenase (cytochrome)
LSACRQARARHGHEPSRTSRGEQNRGRGAVDHQDQTRGHFGRHGRGRRPGKVLWTAKGEGDCSGDRRARYAACQTRIGFSPAPLVVDGAVIQRSVDGILRVFDAESGAELWRYDTMRKFETVNGVAANGGAIDSSPYVAADGMLFVVSGYGRFGEVPGNVLLAFKPKK